MTCDNLLRYAKPNAKCTAQIKSGKQEANNKEFRAKTYKKLA